MPIFTFNKKSKRLSLRKYSPHQKQVKRIVASGTAKVPTQRKVSGFAFTSKGGGIRAQARRARRMAAEALGKI